MLNCWLNGVFVFAKAWQKKFFIILRGNNMQYLFETERLRIRRFEMADAPFLYENHSEEALRKWLPNEYYENVAVA